MPGHVLPRRFRVFGLGEAKTGTVTLTRKFGRYRAFHEWDALRMAPKSNDFLRGELTAADARAELRRRSWRFNMEFDCGHFMSPFAGLLAEQYDDARFVLLVRDCFSWLDSRIEYVLLKGPVLGRDSMEARYGQYGEHFHAGESALAAAGLFPIAAYLQYWSELTAQVMRDVPSERLLIVRTEDLDDSNERLAAFVGVDPSTISTVHFNHNEARTGILETVPNELIVELAQEHCTPLMQRFWGDNWVDLAARLDYK
jgi:hypothetical protein